MAPNLGISAITCFRGLEVSSGQSELIRLPAYGEPRFVAEILDEPLDLEYDPGQRRFDRGAGSHWQARERPGEDERRYFRQS